jgi:hypothetical protein
VLTDAGLATRMMAGQRTSLGFFTRGIERRRNTLRLPPIARLHARPTQRQRGIKSCNMAFWREDLLRLNGFNEAMTGWGREDTELAIRAFHAGLLRRDVRFSALAFHLHHPSRKNVLDNPNDRILATTRTSGVIRCAVGLDQYLPAPETSSAAMLS